MNRNRPNNKELDPEVIEQLALARMQRLLIGVISIVMIVIAIGSLCFLGLDDSTGVWAFGAFAKMGCIFGLIWLAWPQLKWVKDLPGGWAALVVMAGAACIFVARPKLLLYVVPYLAATIGIFVTLAWLQRLTGPKR